MDDKLEKLGCPYKEGEEISCILGTNRYKITSGKIHYEDGRIYICQNVVSGVSCEDKLGYSHSWVIVKPDSSYSTWEDGCKNYSMIDIQRVNDTNLGCPYEEGQEISCTLSSSENKIDSGKIHYEDGNIFICQDEEDGNECKDKLGYRYSWVICGPRASKPRWNEGVEYYKVKNIQLINLESNDFGCPYKEGDSVEGSIRGKSFTFGKIHYENHSLYLCQDVKEGSEPHDKLGYRYGWKVCGTNFVHKTWDEGCVEYLIVINKIEEKVDTNLGCPYEEGQMISCEIQGQTILEAKIHYENGDIYLCQDKKEGAGCVNKLGYKYSWGMCGHIFTYKTWEEGCEYYRFKNIKTILSESKPEHILGCPYEEGQLISCKIQGCIVKQARIHYEGGSIYICQDVEPGTCCEDKLGYKYSWVVAGINADDANWAEGCNEHEVTNISVESFNTFKVGDRVTITSYLNNQSGHSTGYSFVIKEIGPGIWYREHEGKTTGVKASSLKLAEQSEKVESLSPFSVGDRVKIISNADNYTKHSIGYIFEIAEIKDNGVGLWHREVLGVSHGIKATSLVLAELDIKVDPIDTGTTITRAVLANDPKILEESGLSISEIVKILKDDESRCSLGDRVSCNGLLCSRDNCPFNIDSSDSDNPKSLKTLIKWITKDDTMINKGTAVTRAVKENNREILLETGKSFKSFAKDLTNSWCFVPGNYCSGLDCTGDRCKFSKSIHTLQEAKDWVLGKETKIKKEKKIIELKSDIISRAIKENNPNILKEYGKSLEEIAESLRQSGCFFPAARCDGLECSRDNCHFYDDKDNGKTLEAARAWVLRDVRKNSLVPEPLETVRSDKNKYFKKEYDPSLEDLLKSVL